MTIKLTEALNNWREMPLDQPPEVVKTFTAGLNHQTHLIQSGSTQFVLKLFQQAEPNAIAAQQWATKHGLAPRIVYANQSSDIVLMEFVTSNTITHSDITHDTLKLLAMALRKLHDLPTSELARKIGHFDLKQFCETYLKQVDQPDTLSPKIHAQLLPALNTFIHDNTPHCICHNDLVTANCFVAGTVAQPKAFFIDWEYAQIHNPWFDLAAIIYYFKLTADQSKDFLNHYRDGWACQFEAPISVAAQISLLWGDMLWHLARGDWNSWPDLQKKLADLRQLALKLDISI